jgi:glucose/mannose-6-phosphate isomerase
VTEASFEPDRLDDQAFLEEADPGGVLREVASSAARIRVAHRAAAEAGVPSVAADGRPRAIVVAGSGGAGLTGDLLAAICGYAAPLPIVTVRGHRLPGWVGAADLVAAVSAPGTTEETLAAATEAARRGCRLLAVGAEGSPLEAVARQASAPFVRVPAPVGRSTGPAPGTGHEALWPLSIPLVVMAGALGLTRGVEEACEAAAARLEDIAHRCRPGSESFINPGKTLAMELAGTVPMIWGSAPIATVAARHLAGRLQVTAKYPATWGDLPDATHDQMAAFDGPLAERDIFAEGPSRTLRLVLLRDDADEHPRAARLREVATRLADDRHVPISELRAEEGHPLVRLAGLAGVCDYASVYLALGYGIDPASVPIVSELRARITP